MPKRVVLQVLAVNSLYYPVLSRFLCISTHLLVGQYTRCGILYYPVWQASSPRRKATNSTTTSSKVPASTASPASFIKPTSVPPRNSPRWSAIAPPPSPWPPPPASLACPPPSGPPLSKPASRTCCNRSGLRHAPDLRLLTI